MTAEGSVVDEGDLVGTVGAEKDALTEEEVLTEEEPLTEGDKAGIVLTVEG